MEKTIPIIIVTYNKVEQFTIPCIESIIQNTRPPYRVIVVDNNSQDDTPNILRSRFESIDVICSGGNLGWAGGNLIGIEYIDKHYDYDYFCLLNSDTLVSNDWLAKLKNILSKNDRATTIVPTERIIRRNIVKDCYNNFVSRNKSLRTLIASTPLKRLMGRGLVNTEEIKPVPEPIIGLSLNEIDRLNSMLEKKFGERVSRSTYVTTGYCILIRKTSKEDMVTFLINFTDLFPGKSIDYWNEISRRKNIEHLQSRGTYVYHFRGGSGGY